MIRFKKNIILFIAAMCFSLSALAQEKLPPGVKRLENGDLKVDDIILRVKQRELAFPAKFELQEGALEVIVAKPDGRLHETLLVTKSSALQIQTLLYLLDASNGPRLKTQFEKQGDIVDIDIEWKDDEGTSHRDPIESWIASNKTGKPIPRIGWVFVGSTIQNGVFQADAEGNIVINWSVGATVLDFPDPDSEDDTLHSVYIGKKQPVKYPDVTIVIVLRKK